MTRPETIAAGTQPGGKRGNLRHHRLLGLGSSGEQLGARGPGELCLAYVAVDLQGNRQHHGHATSSPRRGSEHPTPPPPWAIPARSSPGQSRRAQHAPWHPRAGSRFGLSTASAIAGARRKPSTQHLWNRLSLLREMKLQKLVMASIPVRRSRPAERFRQLRSIKAIRGRIFSDRRALLEGWIVGRDHGVPSRLRSRCPTWSASRKRGADPGAISGPRLPR